jgi:hypothetical protein
LAFDLSIDYLAVSSAGLETMHWEDCECALSFMLFSWMAKKYFAITNHLQPEPEAEFDSFEKTRTYLVDKANRIHKTLPLKIAFMKNSRIREQDENGSYSDRDWFSEGKMP